MTKQDWLIFAIAWLLGILLGVIYKVLPQHIYVWASCVFLGCVLIGPAIILPVVYLILYCIKKGAHNVKRDKPSGDSNNIPGADCDSECKKHSYHWLRRGISSDAADAERYS